MSKIVLVAHDTAPSLAFELIGKALKDNGLEVHLFIDKGQPTTFTDAEVLNAVTKANLVLIGMSSTPALAQIEILAGTYAVEAGVPFGMFGDINGCWARARPDGGWFHEIAAHAAFYLGASQDDANKASEVFPQKTQLTGTGNPRNDNLAFANFTRKQISKKLGIPANSTLFLIPGGKFQAGNIITLATVMEALAMRNKDGNKRQQLVFGHHPGDQSPLELYQALISYSPVPAILVHKEILSTADIVPHARLVIEMGSASSTTQAAFFGIPAIAFAPNPVIGFYNQELGGRPFPSVTNGIAELIHEVDPRQMLEVMEKLLTPSGSKAMRARQRELYPKPQKPGSTLERVVSEIMAFLP